MTSTRPKALLLTPVLPEPGGSGRGLRAFCWLETLARTHEVHVLVFGAHAPIPGANPSPRAASVRFVAAHVSRLWWLAMVLPPLVLRPGFGTDWLQMAPSDHDPLDGLPEPERIVVFRLYLHDIARAVITRFPGARAEIDLDDSEARTRMSVARCLVRLGRWRAALRETAIALQYAIAERFMTAPYRIAYLAAPEDIARLPRSLRGKAKVFANRLAPPRLRPGPLRHFLFVGALDYRPNEEAVRFLLDRLAWRDHPLLIVGHGASEALRARIAREKHVTLMAGADDLGSAYGEAIGVLVPLFSGGGTKLKTIEAFAHGRPVIATPQGARGLGARAGTHYIEAWTPRAFTDAMTRLARDEDGGTRIGQAGQALWRGGFMLE
jgi:glycosyltransferase involved in cell wall biosynthesis